MEKRYKELQNATEEVLLNELTEMSAYWNSIQQCIHKIFEGNNLKTKVAKTVLRKACENIIQRANFKVLSFIMDGLITELGNRGYNTSKLTDAYIVKGFKND